MKPETELNESTFIAHLPCKSCGSSDANSLYDDGHTFCFSCNTYGSADKTNQPTTKINMQTNNTLIQGECKPLPKRNITLESTTFWNYQIAEDKGQKVQVATYYNKDKQPVFQKIRDKDKNFRTLGTIKEALLYGQEKWNSGGRICCVCEGEIDTISLSQIFNHKYATVGIPNGVNGAVKSIKNQLEYLESFQTVVVFFRSR
jgi:twinkle protein